MPASSAEMRLLASAIRFTDNSVSSQHFTVEADGNSYVLRDAGSTNGTFYGDIRIREIFLRPGTVFRARQLGEFVV